jgi:ribosome biogenesis protein Nip4
MLLHQRNTNEGSQQYQSRKSFTCRNLHRKVYKKWKIPDAYYSFGIFVAVCKGANRVLKEHFLICDYYVITVLLTSYALCFQYKVWVKQSSEMSFLYGNHVTKNGLARMTENTPQYAGVVVYNMQDIALGFGVAAQTTDYCQTLVASGNVVLHQADIGDYLRGLEDDMF